MDTEIIKLQDDCRFHYGNCEEAWYKGYDDSAWEKVFLPHDYSVSAPFSKEYSSGTGYVRGGIAWYRIYVRIPEEYRQGTLDCITYNVPYSDMAHENTWRKWRQILIWELAKNLFLI